MKKSDYTEPTDLFGFQNLYSIPQDDAYDFSELFTRLSQSEFRMRFHLSGKNKEYIRIKSIPTIRHHAKDFVARRLSPAVIPNDGKQTPMHGHPVFVAQHATGCCCRKCLMKWHHIPPGRELTIKEQQYIIAVLMEWIKRDLKTDIDIQETATLP